MEAEPKAGAVRPSGVLLGALAILAAGAWAYGRSFSVPFLFDDRPAIMGNPTIRDLGSLAKVLSPPHGGVGVEGRPIVNLSLALNYAAGGLNPWGYHAVNLGIHLVAGLLLFGIVRRTLFQVRVGGTSTGRDSTWLALAVALLWTVHPLLTESVTCVIQRTESLMGMFYLLTLYCFIRDYSSGGNRKVFVGADSRTENESLTASATRIRSSGTRKRFGAIWAAISVTACLLGMATKEVMVTAPLMVFLYDRTFIAGTFSAAWNRRRSYYLALFATWLLLGWLVIGEGGSRDASAGFGHGVTPWRYALTQCWGIAHYLRLAVWPSPLILDYGTDVVGSLRTVWLQAILLIGLLSVTILAWITVAERVSVSERVGLRTTDENLTVSATQIIAFLGAWFFLILAPSSSFLPLVSQTVAEHRMYLPLAAVIVLFVVLAHRVLDRKALVLLFALAAALGALTVRRNRDYRSEIAIWSDTVAKRPGNARAEDCLASAYLAAGKWPEAVAHDEAALRLRPTFADARSNLGDAFLQGGRRADAIAAYRQALASDPHNADILDNLGSALDGGGDAESAVPLLRRALTLKPEFAVAEYNLGNALRRLGRTEEAIGHYARAVRLNPDFAEGENNLAVALSSAGRVDEALPHLRAAVRLDPGNTQARENLRRALNYLGRP